MTNYQSYCELHTNIEFPVRSDKRDADEDRYAHARIPGSHTVGTREIDAPSTSAEGFPPAGAADRLAEKLDHVLESYK